jgi:hypothetical protein
VGEDNISPAVIAWTKTATVCMVLATRKTMRWPCLVIVRVTWRGSPFSISAVFEVCDPMSQ